MSEPVVQAPANKAADTSEGQTSQIAKRPGFEDVRAADIPPVLVNPQWPNLIREGFIGQVTLGVVVSPEGHAISVEVLEGTGNADWDYLLTKMLRRSAYLPGRTAGKAVLCSQRFRVTFRRR